MTKNFREYTETVDVKKRELINTTCDKCGAVIDTDSFDIRDFELKFATGRGYPEGGHKEGWQVNDLCDSCAEWLKDVLIDNDVNLTKLELDW